MSWYVFVGADTLGHPAAIPPGVDGPAPDAPPYYLVFPMPGDRNVDTSPQPPQYPIEVAYEAEHKRWWREREMEVAINIDFGPGTFVLTKTVSITRRRSSDDGAITDEEELMVFTNNYWKGLLDQSVGGEIRIITVTVTLMEVDAVTPFVCYTWNTDNINLRPRLRVQVGVSWAVGSDFSVNLDSYGTTGNTAVGTYFGNGPFSLLSNSSETFPFTDATVIITAPASNGFFPWDRDGSPTIDVDTGDPL